MVAWQFTATRPSEDEDDDEYEDDFQRSGELLY